MFLLREAGRVVTREHLVDAVLSRKFSPFDRSIDMHVSKVRKKLGDSDNGSDHIKTVRGVGYIFAHPARASREQGRQERGSMRSLFVRIFLSYWIATALFLVLAIIVTLAIRPSGEIASVQSQQAKVPQRVSAGLSGGGEEGARKYLRGVRDSQHVRLYLFDEHGPGTARTPAAGMDRTRRARPDSHRGYILGTPQAHAVLARVNDLVRRASLHVGYRVASRTAHSVWPARHSWARDSDRDYFHPGWSATSSLAI